MNMERTRRDSLISLCVGGGISVGLYWLIGDVSLAFVTGLCWACGIKLTFHIGDLYPAYTTGDTWADQRWAGLGIGLITLASINGLSPMLSLSNGLRLGLGLLVIGTGFVAYTAGTLTILERVEGDSNDSTSQLANSD